MVQLNQSCTGVHIHGGLKQFHCLNMALLGLSETWKYIHAWLIIYRCARSFLTRSPKIMLIQFLLSRSFSALVFCTSSKARASTLNTEAHLRTTSTRVTIFLFCRSWLKRPHASLKDWSSYDRRGVSKLVKNVTHNVDSWQWAACRVSRSQPHLQLSTSKLFFSQVWK